MMGEDAEANGPIRVLLADDHTMFRQGLAGGAPGRGYSFGHYILGRGVAPVQSEEPEPRRTPAR